jgi:hypothetical protein
MLFFLVIQQSSMMGEIVNYADFLKMEKKIYTFDIVIMACIGKEEIGTDVSVIHPPFRVLVHKSTGGS